jgi:signal transduction histidine kinase
LVFGLRWQAAGSGWERRSLAVTAGLWVLLGLLAAALAPQVNGPEFWPRTVDVLARYTLGVPGAALAAAALAGQARLAGRQSRAGLSGSLQLAAVGFGAYSLTQLLVPALPGLFPARVLNADLFFQWTGLPVQVVRASLAVIITVAIMRVVQQMELERQEQFQEAQQARLAALEQVRQELVEREELRRNLLRHTVLAQEDERARIARELHDETAQLLTGFSLHLAAAGQSAGDNPRLQQQIDRLQELSGQMSQGIYRLVRDLRPAQLDDLGLVAALRYLAGEIAQQAGLQVELRFEGQAQRLDPLVETVIFRVAQEALSNVARHAGVTRARLILAFTPLEVVLQVSDTGSGFDPQAELRPPHGWGLAGMRERAESIGGQLLIQSTPGQGACIEVRVPRLTTLALPERGQAG